MVMTIRAVVFKMSDKPEGSDSKPDSQEGERVDGSKGPSLKDATHKLKAEALRRLQLGGAEYESEGAKTDETRQGSSQNDDSNVQETSGVDNSDWSEIQPEKSDVSSEEKENNVDGTDRNDSRLNVDETGVIEGSSGDSAKPNDDILGDSVHAGENVEDAHRQNKQGSDVLANEGDEIGSEVKDQSVKKGNVLSSQGENAKEIDSDKPSSKDTRPSSSQGQKGASGSSRPGSRGARPGSASKRAGKGEGSQQKPGSRPGSGSGSRSRPGSGSKRAQHEKQSSSRPGSAAASRSRPQSGSKREAEGSEGGTLGPDGFSSGGTGEGTIKKDSASVDDEGNKLKGDISRLEASRDGEGDGLTNGETVSSSNIIEGTSQTPGTESGEQGKEHHGDASNLTVNNKSADNTSAQTLSGDNKPESKQEGDENKNISDEVSPPMNEEASSKDQGADSKQSSDSLSNDKQDAEVTDAGKDAKEEEHSDSVKDDEENTSSSDQAGKGGIDAGEQKDVSKALQEEEGSKDKNTTGGLQEGEANTGDKDGSGADSSGDRKLPGETQEGDAHKAEGAESDQPGAQTNRGAGEKDDAEESSDKQTAESKKGADAADMADGKKEDGGEIKKKKKKVKKESKGQEGDIEDEEDEEHEETEKTDGEPQTTQPKQDAPGR